MSVAPVLLIAIPVTVHFMRCLVSVRSCEAVCGIEFSRSLCAFFPGNPKGMIKRFSDDCQTKFFKRRTFSFEVTLVFEVES
jgi:hypothetical protein